MRKRRHRAASIEKQIADKARAVQKDGMAEIIRTATLIVVGQKLDEIRSLLQIAGIGSVSQSMSVGNAIAVQPSTAPSVPTIQHPCSYCGRESVYRTKPHRFNRTGTWLCQAHYPLRRQHESSAGAVADVPQESVSVPTVQNVGPVVNGGPPLPSDKPDTGGDVGMADAFAAVGIQTSAN